MRCYYLLSGLALGALAHAGPVCPRDDGIKNLIYIVPDGYGPASQTMARDFTSLMNGAKPDGPVSISLPADDLVCVLTYHRSTCGMLTASLGHWKRTHLLW